MAAIKNGKNASVEVRFHAYNRSGNAMAKLPGVPKEVVVAGGARGEVAQVEILGGGRKQKYARIQEIRSAHEGRIQPKCPQFSRCGGCGWMFLQPEAALQEKIAHFQSLVESTLGKEALSTFVEATPSPSPWAYRYRSNFVIGGSKGALRLGAYAARSHNIVDVAQCPVTHPILLSLRDHIWQQLNDSALPAYDEKSGEGVFRHISLQLNGAADAAMVVLVVAREAFKEGENSASAIDWEKIAATIQKHPQVLGVYLNLQPERSNRLIGHQWTHLSGEIHSLMNYGDVKVFVPPGGFCQVNHLAAQKLYQRVWDWARPAPLLIDLYCGVGAIGLGMASSFERLIGIEVNEASVSCATRNAEANGVQSATFLAGEVSEKLLAAQGEEDCVMVVNPPRSGVGQSGLALIAKIRPAQLLYVSCGPKALVRELRQLRDMGYRLDALAPHDLFPQTHHLEVVARLQWVDGL